MLITRKNTTKKKINTQNLSRGHRQWNHSCPACLSQQRQSTGGTFPPQGLFPSGFLQLCAFLHPSNRCDSEAFQAVFLWLQCHEPLLLWYLTNPQIGMQRYVHSWASRLCFGYCYSCLPSYHHCPLLRLHSVYHSAYTLHPGKKEGLLYLCLPSHCGHNLLHSHDFHVRPTQGYCIF